VIPMTKSVAAAGEKAVTFTVEIRGQNGCIRIGPEWSGQWHGTTYATLEEAKAAALKEKRSHDWAVRVVGSDGSIVPVARQRATLPLAAEGTKPTVPRFTRRKGATR
jgi:hypothetical protein